jgi:hypothetical protein
MKSLPAAIAVLLSGCTIDSELFLIQTPEDLRTHCESEEPELFEFLVYFDDQEPSCPWGEADNLIAEEATVTARVVDTVEVYLPEDAVFCGLELDFDPTGTGQVMEYDDDFFLNMSDVVLLASDNTQVAVMPKDEMLPLFEWSALAGAAIDFGDIPPFCLGETEGLSSCSVPPDETPAPIDLSMDQTLVDELAFRIFEAGALNFSFVTLGDNDAEKDCSHEAYQLMVRMPYVSKPKESVD